MKTRLILFLLTILGTVACDPNRVYEKNIEYNNRIWIADSIEQFDFQIPDISQKYNLYFNVRNTVDYPYHNLYINYTLSDTLGNVIKQDLLNNDLFHPKTGNPYGEGLGDIFSHQFLLVKEQQFQSMGTYRISLQQYMRQDSLYGILSSGIRVERANNDN